MDLLSTLAPSAQTIHALLTDESIPPNVKQSSVTRAVLRSATSGDTDLLEYLLLSSRDYADLSAVDSDGSPALVLAACFGFGDAARLLVEAGASLEAPDRAGWTALHWAAQNGDIVLASYLLNHGARCDVRSFKGLLPHDLARRNQAGEELKDMLDAATDARSEQLHSLPSSSRQSINSAFSEASAASSSARAERKSQLKKAQKRSQLAHESAQHLSVKMDLLGIPDHDSIATNSSSPLASPSLAMASDHTPEFDWDQCQPSQMLVFAMNDLPLLFHAIISSIEPKRSLVQRVLPANVLFLCTRFAVHFGDAELLDELLLGSIEAIEDVVRQNSDDLASCSFWLSNAVLLLYYLRLDQSTTEATLEYQTHWAELVNELYVYVIRDIERRVDKIADPALLDHEPLPGFEDLRFEGEWSFVKAFTSGPTRNRNASAQSTMAAGQSTAATPPRHSIISLFSNSETPSPSKSNFPRSQSVSHLQPVPHSLNNGNGESSASGAPSPKDIASILTSALVILQLYEIHPFLIAQAFSQVFYWLSSEITNRLLTRRKYLCRSKALQIRLNISSLEDWARLNGLPTKLVSDHFKPVGQLLQWLQCLSSEDTLDGLVGTMMNFRELNPFQLRKVVRDYRYEVDESHMSDECVQYLAQLEKDWEKQRVAKSAKLARDEELEDDRTAAEGEDSFEGDDTIVTREDAELAEHQTPGERRRIRRMRQHIDDVFSDSTKYHLFEPPPRTECLGELLDSRYMLPFALPSNPMHLLAIGQPHAFGPLSRSGTPKNGDAKSPCPSPDPTGPDQLPFYDSRYRFVPVLPDGFLAQLDTLRASHTRPVLAADPHVKGPAHEGSSDVTGLGIGVEHSSTDTPTANPQHWDDWRTRLAEEMRQLEIEERSSVGHDA